MGYCTQTLSLQDQGTFDELTRLMNQSLGEMYPNKGPFSHILSHIPYMYIAVKSLSTVDYSPVCAVVVSAIRLLTCILVLVTDHLANWSSP